MQTNRKITEKVIDQAKAGFTLVELLVVVAIIGILGAVAVQNVTQHIAKARITATQESIATIQQALTTYSIDHGGKFPDTLEPLVTAEGDEDPLLQGGTDALNDAWGNPLNYEKRGKKMPKITSNGPDEEPGTEDDLTNIAKK